MESMKKVLMGLSLGMVLVLGACGSSEVETGGSGNSTEKKEVTETPKETKKEENVKLVDAVSQVTTVAGMQVGLGEIKITEDKIAVGINLQNTTNEVLNFYPDQGQLVVGDMQLNANMFMTTGQVGGEVQGGVKQEGVIEFLAPEGKKIDINTVTGIRLIFGDVITADYMTAEPVEFTVPVQ
jgi:hypothetical protein